MPRTSAILWLLAIALAVQPVAAVWVAMAPCCCGSDVDSVATAMEAIPGSSCCEGAAAACSSDSEVDPNLASSDGDAEHDADQDGCDCSMPCCTASGKISSAVPGPVAAPLGTPGASSVLPALPDTVPDAEATQLKRPPRAALSV